MHFITCICPILSLSSPLHASISLHLPFLFSCLSHHYSVASSLSIFSAFSLFVPHPSLTVWNRFLSFAWFLILFFSPFNFSSSSLLLLSLLLLLLLSSPFNFALLFCSVLFSSLHSCSLHFFSVLFCSLHFYSLPFTSVLSTSHPVSSCPSVLSFSLLLISSPPFFSSSSAVLNFYPILSFQLMSSSLTFLYFASLTLII